MLLERGELISGTTGRHHGQLHCGARYAVHDPDIAVPCREESAILRRIAPASIEFNYGLFVAVSDEDASYRDTFLTACQTCGIPARGLTRSEALRMEPGLNPDIRLAVLVPDGTIDAWRLPMQFLATARRNGADIRSFCEVVGLESTGGRVRAVRVRDRRGDSEYELEADVVVNAGGPWVGRIAGMARIPIGCHSGAGSAGRGQGPLGQHGDKPSPPRRRRGHYRAPAQSLYHRFDPMANARSRPGRDSRRARAAAARARRCDDAGLFSGRNACGLVGRYAPWEAAREAPTGMPSAARTTFWTTRATDDGIEGLISILGGKATVLRAMAEGAVDMVCRKLGRSTACTTARVPLLADWPQAFFSELEADWSYLRPSEWCPEARTPEELARFERFESCIECGACVSAPPALHVVLRKTLPSFAGIKTASTGSRRLRAAPGPLYSWTLQWRGTPRHVPLRRATPPCPGSRPLQSSICHSRGWPGNAV